MLIGMAQAGLAYVLYVYETAAYVALPVVNVEVSRFGISLVASIAFFLLSILLMPVGKLFSGTDKGDENPSGH